MPSSLTYALGADLSSLCRIRLDVLLHALNATYNLTGEIWECGVYKGGSAVCMRAHMGADCRRTMRLFDTFEGIPEQGQYDTHPVGAFHGTAVDGIRALFAETPDVRIHPGMLPATFSGLEDSQISVAHIDVDQHDAVLACLAFIYPRMQAGGWIILDDYACPGCPGATRAVDTFMADKPEKVVVTLGTPQAWFVKGMEVAS